jgi:hypothetical protein
LIGATKSDQARSDDVDEQARPIRGVRVVRTRELIDPHETDGQRDGDAHDRDDKGSEG